MNKYELNSSRCVIIMKSGIINSRANSIQKFLISNDYAFINKKMSQKLEQAFILKVQYKLILYRFRAIHNAKSQYHEFDAIKLGRYSFSSFWVHIPFEFSLDNILHISEFVNNIYLFWNLESRARREKDKFYLNGNCHISCRVTGCICSSFCVYVLLLYIPLWGLSI